MNVSPDPLGHFTRVPTNQIVEACGIIPHWVLEYAQGNHTMPLIDYLSLVYGFPVHEMRGVTITPEGIFQYPGDHRPIPPD
jgi:hypothetical protein